MMDLKRIKELIELFADTNLGELSLREGDCELRLARRAHAMAGSGTTDSSHRTEVPGCTTADTAHSATYQPIEAKNADAVEVGYERSAKDVVAPMHGILHLSPSPDAPPFVSLGEAVRVGQTLGVLEAMKVFHTLKADVDGVVSGIFVSSGNEVAAGQAVFRIT